MSNYGGTDPAPPGIFNDRYAICIAFTSLFQNGEADETVFFSCDHDVGLSEVALLLPMPFKVVLYIDHIPLGCMPDVNSFSRDT
jgi:hypothetical protein